jgi:hypothetical protein
MVRSGLQVDPAPTTTALLHAHNIVSQGTVSDCSLPPQCVQLPLDVLVSDLHTGWCTSHGTYMKFRDRLGLEVGEQIGRRASCWLG